MALKTDDWLPRLYCYKAAEKKCPERTWRKGQWKCKGEGSHLKQPGKWCLLSLLAWKGYFVQYVLVLSCQTRKEQNIMSVLLYENTSVMPPIIWLKYYLGTWTSFKIREASHTYLFELLLFKPKSTLFHTREVTEVHDWLVSVWLTGDRVYAIRSS